MDKETVQKKFLTHSGSGPRGRTSPALRADSLALPFVRTADGGFVLRQRRNGLIFLVFPEVPPINDQLKKLMNYWSNRSAFRAQSELLEGRYVRIEDGFNSNASPTESFRTLGDEQRRGRIGCVYLSGTRIDNKFCFASESIGVLHSALYTDLPKAIVPAFHADHDEIIAVTHGQVAIEYSTSLAESSGIEQIVLNPGDYFIVRRNWPHRISATLLRSAINPASPEIEPDLAERLSAGFFAFKIGRLSGKSDHENMLNWEKSGSSHPLLQKYQEDNAYLAQLNSQVRDQLHMTG